MRASYLTIYVGGKPFFFVTMKIQWLGLVHYQGTVGNGDLNALIVDTKIAACQVMQFRRATRINLSSQTSS
jgi:hypothetical protein